MKAASTGAVGPVRWAAVSWPIDGESVCGDVSVAVPTEDGALLAVIDGLGHGREAAEAATLAARTLEAEPSRPVDAGIVACHQALVRTRGAVMSVVRLHRAELTWTGVGNVEALLVHGPNRPPGRARLLLFGGVVGQAYRTLRVSSERLFRGDLLVLATDGLRSDFSDAVEATASPQRVVDVLMASCRTGRDDALALAARFDGALT
jgi:negative regulator of sigma-B (phosphoserine phosphatase)